VRVPDARLCTDNGAMIAAVGARLLEAGAPGSPMDFPTRSAMPVEVVSWS
jgi:N6-L-threonylcarbamoyladenine synthase